MRLCITCRAHLVRVRLPLEPEEIANLSDDEPARYAWVCPVSRNHPHRGV